MNKSSMRRKPDVQKILQENVQRWRNYKSPRINEAYFLNIGKSFGFLRSEDNARS